MRKLSYLLIGLVLALIPLGHAQQVLLSVPRQQFLDLKGKPLAGGKVYLYRAGTNTPLVTFTESIGLVQNPKPLILGSGGFGGIWLGPHSYEIVLQNALQWASDNVSGQNLLSSGTALHSPIIDNANIFGWNTYGGNKTYSGVNTFGTPNAVIVVTESSIPPSNPPSMP